METLTIDNVYGIPGISVVYVNHDQDMPAVLTVLLTIRSAFRFKLFLHAIAPGGIKGGRGGRGESHVASMSY